MDEKSAAGDSKDAKSHRFFTFERTIELLKLGATIWIAFVGSYVTMQFNERQHELSRMEAIAKMLPHVSASDSDVAVSATKAADDDARTAVKAPTTSNTMLVAAARTPLVSKPDMGKDGAIWAIFRTAKNKAMLRDLASLFPEDIYRVVSSIAVAGGLEHDEDAVTALEVASEKLAARYAADPNRAELATRLYTQAARLKERKPDDNTPLYIVDLMTPEIDSPPSQDQEASLIAALNKLATLHLNESHSSKHINTGHWQAKQLFRKARLLGLNSTDKLVQMQVASADKGLAEIHKDDGHYRDALVYLREARSRQATAYGETSTEVSQTDAEIAKIENQLKAQGVQVR